ncbi:TetR/AcrR family transcriptional regulator [Nocardia terpenica]|uniref:TetR/AcrR family transcriptional regulator n=1 Tax=Nocardia terpenica TaxID=455432 RepID=UPI001894CB95|nr:TetR/AcrR family transcriptional regulator [Nocardia terpenica]MBF6059669.1 TetR/AcrR family transcriptional regulator [Nocardia terpenica]MBF6102790.1 TetR/AcrR family transcriptional regulator [Nocardia terpenica]MBF6111019.1 TetR/AcrR family transcriptional regulator [Nocardia terpenica]MBF6117150.1 TetR/AcrR family transcriptional regulator [Nocardia terpenica]MBF6151009.1 TetR/AcrR family transcriptional regulator [Nocardia terpenica]
MREQLVDAGLRLLEEDGPEALQTRRVAAAVGASTMAVYTHFDGMTGLMEAIAAEAFARFGTALEAVRPSDDPIADVLLLGYAYRGYALASPQRYRLMFGLTGPRTALSPHSDFAIGDPGSAIGAATFEPLVAAIERLIEGGHVRPDPPREVATRLWALVHGTVLLEIAGFLGSAEHSSLPVILGPATIDFLVGMGCPRKRAERSMARVRKAVGNR